LTAFNVCFKAFKINLGRYSTVVQVRITVVTGRANDTAAAADTTTNPGTKRKVQRRRRVLLSGGGGGGPDADEEEVGWSADGVSSSSAFLGRWHHRSLLQAAAASSDLDTALQAASDAIGGRGLHTSTFGTSTQAALLVGYIASVDLSIEHGSD
jgi:hypothetical protein